MKLGLAALILVGCSATPGTVDVPTTPNAINVTVDRFHCKPLQSQPSDPGLTSVICVGDKSTVAVVLSTDYWNALAWSSGR